MVARESGTVAGTNPTAVTGQVGRLLKIVNWTSEAWLQIQNHRPDWDWMADTFTGSVTLAGGTTYTPEGSFSLTRFGSWRQDDLSTGFQAMSLYETATGVSDEQPLSQISWRTWRERYFRGTQTADRPLEWAITPAKSIAVGPTPDATYTLRGEFFHRANTMAANTDEPELPDQFHPLIAWWAIIILHGHDEALVSGPALTHAKEQKAIYLKNLENAELPGIAIGGGPLA
jgi:hypothetical protein